MSDDYPRAISLVAPPSFRRAGQILFLTRAGSWSTRPALERLFPDRDHAIAFVRDQLARRRSFQGCDLELHIALLARL